MAEDFGFVPEGATATAEEDYGFVPESGHHEQFGFVPEAQGTSVTARTTGYTPENTRMEGGPLDRNGKPLQTLDMFRRGEAAYVGVAGDPRIPYGTPMTSPQFPGVPFKVTDTGDAFKGQGLSRFDIARDNQAGATSEENNRQVQFDLADPSFALAQAEPQQEAPQQEAPQQEAQPYQPEDELANLIPNETLRNAVAAGADTYAGLIPTTLKGVAELATPLTQTIEGVATLGRIANDVRKGMSFDEAQKKEYPEGQILANAATTKPYSRERFAAGFDTAAQLLMAAGITKGLTNSLLPKGPLKEVPPAFQGLPQIEEPNAPTNPSQAGAGAETSPSGTSPVLGQGAGPAAPNAGEAAGAGTVGAPAEATPQTTGVANRVFEKEAKAGLIDEVLHGEGMSWQEMVDMGRAKLNGGADPQAIATEFKKTGRLSADEFSVLRAERERLAVVSNQAADALAANPASKDLQTRLSEARQRENDFIQNTVQPAKTATSNIFRGMQGEAPIDVTTFEGLRRAVLDQKFHEPTPAQAKKLELIAKDVQRAQAAERKAVKDLGDKMEKTLPKNRTPTKAELQAEIAKMVRELTPCK